MFALNKAPDGSSCGLTAERLFCAARLVETGTVVPTAALAELGASPSVAACAGAHEALSVAVMSSYVVDWAWLATLLPPSLGECTIAVNWLPETRDSENAICRFRVGHRMVELPGPSGGRRIRVVHAPQGKGLMHAKMGVLRFSTFARIFVTTANFTLDDWTNMGQGTWAHDFPITIHSNGDDDDHAAAAIPPDVTADSFAGDLWRALAILGLDGFAGPALRGVDLSASTARLVLSAPHTTVMGAVALSQRQSDDEASGSPSDGSDDDSVHAGAQRGVDVDTAEEIAGDVARTAYRQLAGGRNGICSLRRAVHAAQAACQDEVSRPQLPAGVDNGSAVASSSHGALHWNAGLVTFQASSIGGITDDVLRELEGAVGAPVHALFPSVNSVRAQLDAGNVGAITLRCFQMGQSTLMRQRWHDLTTVLPFHSKLMWHEVPAAAPGTVAGWVFAGSHNLTSDSWCFTRRIPAPLSGGPPQPAFDSDPRNIEIGVVVPYVRSNSVVGSVFPAEFGAPMAAAAAATAPPDPFVFLRHRSMVLEAGERSGMTQADPSDAAHYHWSKFAEEYSNPFGRH